ncbi:similar to Saccharomyces cerevisiae YDR492W IZH1 Membrane protein involved in zinc ion homeostasis, member of the four-protein IZH family [Maudiozyma saulgeensis]|uniref:Similar to Saccharomyces cerevisiae YDR492W IZH1 Membrane protein involved in zinc ion homeostasis, member of the four-protein IZH family n=1 Tax=Maudiozyma saulgeensis TaxID=1789683 RepID=A0A1X7R8C6_9SACH|nr:similar to Saccharomyces cerevisiae YDR492W IZH1 Membrane protein involved in zinc ion homeostasis, member of the four-protein IZH family [Kazachstania saulgeensis]
MSTELKADKCAINYTNSYLKSLQRSLTVRTDDTIVLCLTALTSFVYFFLLISFTDLYLIPKYHSTTMTDYIILNLYLASAFQASFLNWIYHMFKSHSSKKATQWKNINLYGMVTYLVSSAISLLYYGFYDNVFYFKLLTISTFLLNLIMVILINLHDDKHQTQSYRLLLAIFITVLIVMPLSVSYWQFGIQKIQTKIDFPLLLIEIIGYIISGVLYINRVPERLGLSRSCVTAGYYTVIIITSFIHFKVLLNSFVMMRIGLNKPTLINFDS